MRTFFPLWTSSPLPPSPHSECRTVASKLTMLASNGSLTNFNTDTPTLTRRVGRWAAQCQTLPVARRLCSSKLAYWDDLIVTVDEQSNLWNVEVVWTYDAYTVSHKTIVDPFVEFTANDAGLVALRSDRFLWQRYVQPASSGSDDPTLQ